VSTEIISIPTGFIFLSVAPPAGGEHLAGENRSAIYLGDGGTVADADLTIASRPGDTATYQGTSVCLGCHTSITPSITTDYGMAAHGRSVTGETSGAPAPGTARMLDSSKALFPAVDGTVTISFQALDPTDPSYTAMGPVYLCQNTTAGNYSMQFGGTSCGVGGTDVPISGTYGGEGDGGIDDQPNLGVFKQRFLAKLADVPVTAGWTDYTTGKDKDYLILPVQVTQSGSGAPKLEAYKNDIWCKRDRTFSRACAGCHVVGLQITFDATTFNIKTYGWANNTETASQNVGCESCHGPGSEHAAGGNPLKIINPKYLTADGLRQVCGQCHAADDGKSKNPDGKFGYAWNESHHGDLGGGVFVPGVYDLTDFIKGFGVPSAQGGGFNAWPDGRHGKAHRQQFAMLALSVHTNNPYEKLACADCHNVHSTVQGPAAAVREDGADTFVFHGLTFDNNSLCLSCHAGYGEFASLTKEDVAKLHFADGGSVDKNATTNVAYTSGETTAAKALIGATVSQHMQDQAGMGLAAYDPTNDAMPVGRCSSCHMPRTGKSGGWLNGVDGSGKSALIEGDEGSHVFDIIWPGESSALKKPSGGVDTDIMPNSCGSCHEAARLSGDGT
jgi:mono/diheme cytochrome c family protein